MKASFTTSYEYHYFWVRYKGKVCIAEVREHEPKFYRISGEVLSVLKEDLEILDNIEDYYV